MDYRVKITIRNNHILKAIEEQGYSSVSDFCRKFKLRVASVNSVIAGRYKPLLKNGKILNLSDVVNSEIAWFKDPNLFAVNGVSQQKSSEEELRNLITLYIDNRKSHSSGSSRAQKLVGKGMGERGRRQFGDVTAMLLPNSEQVLGEWVLK